MNSLALFMVDLQMAQGRLHGVFDVVDEMCTARTPSSKMANAQRNLLGRSSINGFDFTEAMEIGIRRAARLSRGLRHDES